MAEELLSDQQQEEILRRWWNSNWQWVLAGFALGLAVLFGWQQWQHRKAETANSAATLYTSFTEALTANDRSKAESLLKDLEAKYSDTPYIDQSHLAMAGAYVETGLYEQAAAELKSVMDHAVDDALKPIATLRWARVQLQLGHQDEALAALDISKAGAFVAQYHDVRGDALLAKGDPSGAKQAYQLALDSAKFNSTGTSNAAPGESMVDEAYLQLKLQDVQAATPAAAPTAAPVATSAAESAASSAH
jgi:predicted negative regulator of RcsB-dependent stress response